MGEGEGGDLAVFGDIDFVGVIAASQAGTQQYRSGCRH
jgi:hypothetical protein